jgi:MFS family permease
MKQINPYESSGSADPQSAYAMGSYSTGARYKVLAFSVAMAVLLYLDRFALNVVQPVVMEELGMSLTEMGWVTSAFFWAYALAQVPAGTLGDRWGGRLALTLFVTTWSIAFGLQAMATGFWMFIIFRVLQGIAQAGAYATTAGFLKNWIEPSWRGRANSAVSMGGRAGGVITNFGTPLLMAALATFLIRYSLTDSAEPKPWRWIFLFYAALGLIWAGIFWWWFRDRPEQHRGVNEAELAAIQAGRLKDESLQADAPVPPWWVVMRSKNMWLLSTIMFCVNIGWIFLATSQTTYLKEVYGSSLVKAGSFTAFTALGGMAGCIAGGFATDWLMRTMGEVWGRRLPGLVSCGGAASMYLLALVLDTPESVVIAFASVYFWNDFLLGSLWSTVQDVGGRNSGAMFGFINMSGNLGAAIFPPVIGMLVANKNWNGVFIVSAAAFMIAFVLWCFVDPRVKLPAHVEA